MWFRSIGNFYRAAFGLYLGLLLTGCGNSNHAPIESGIYQPDKPGQYRVRTGDTLYSVAFAYGVDFRTLADINGISAPYDIKPGQYLFISPGSRPALSSERAVQQTGNKTHTTPSVPRRSQPKSHPAISAVPLGPVQRWYWPARGKIIRNYDPGNGNKGINISGKSGSPIYAAAPGVVVYEGNGLRAYGNLIIIKHNDLYLTAYAHNQRVLVKEGQQVTGGEKIAEMGHTGIRQTMLHFEVRRAGKPVNPLNYLSTR